MVPLVITPDLTTLLDLELARRQVHARVHVLRQGLQGLDADVDTLVAVSAGQRDLDAVGLDRGVQRRQRLRAPPHAEAGELPRAVVEVANLLGPGEAAEQLGGAVPRTGVEDHVVQLVVLGDGLGAGEASEEQRGAEGGCGRTDRVEHGEHGGVEAGPASIQGRA